MGSQFARSGVVDAVVFNPLHLPGKKPVFETVTVLGGQNLQAGAVLGRITASGKLQLVASAAGDGSQTPYGILCHDLSTYAADGTTAQDMTVEIATEGYFNTTALIVGAGYTQATIVPLLPKGIHARSPGYSG